MDDDPDKLSAAATQGVWEAAAELLLGALGNSYDPKNPLWRAIIDAVSREADTSKVRGSDGILIALRAIAQGGGQDG